MLFIDSFTYSTTHKEDEARPESPVQLKELTHLTRLTKPSRTPYR